MTCEPPSFNDKITAASSTYSLVGNYQGNITVADPTGEIDATYLWKRYEIDLTVDSSFSQDYAATPLDPLQESCFSGTIKIASGIISNISYSIDYAGTRQADITIDSFYTRLNSKAISTDPFYQLDTTEVLGSIATIYLGVPVELLDFNTIPRVISGPADGNNAMEELRNIAQAGFSHLFVQTNGLLTAEPWLGRCVPSIEDPEVYVCEEAELDIPCAAIKSASRVLNNELPPTVVRVRGSHIQTFDCGKVDLTDTRTSSLSGRSGYESIGGGVSKTVVVGIPQKDAEVQYNNLAGKKEDINNANVYASGLSLRKMTEVADGVASYSVTGESGFLEKGGVEFYSKIAGNQIPDDFKERNGINKLGKKDNVKNSKKLKRLTDVLRGRPPIFESGPAFGSGTKDGVGHNDSNNTAREESRVQLEVSVTDPALLSVFGVKEEQIDNPYVICKEDLFWIGVRRFQQWKMEQNAWELEIAPMPCLRLNQMITFTPPPSAGVPNPVSVKGVISGIGNDYSPDGSVLTQKLTVLGVDDLCKTVYTSSNLISNFCGVNGSGNWSGSGTSSESMGNISNDSLILYTKGTLGVAFVFLTQPCMEVGSEYTIAFNAELLSGGLPALTFKITDSAAATIQTILIGGSGAYTGSFIATDTQCVFRWDLATIGNPNFWRIYNITLVKAVVA